MPTAPASPSKKTNPPPNSPNRTKDQELCHDHHDQVGNRWLTCAARRVFEVGAVLGSAQLRECWPIWAEAGVAVYKPL